MVDARDAVDITLARRGDNSTAIASGNHSTRGNVHTGPRGALETDRAFSSQKEQG